MSFGSDQGAGQPGGKFDDATEYSASHQANIEREDGAAPRMPADSAEYLEGSCPKYQSGNSWTAGANGGEPVIDVNSLGNPMDPSAGIV